MELAAFLAQEFAKYQQQELEEPRSYQLADEAAGTSSTIGDYTLLEGPETLKIPPSFAKKVSEMGDASPYYTTFAVPAGFSRFLGSNESASEDTPHRYWPESALDVLSNRIRNENGIPGHRGHARTDDHMKELPNPAVLWVSSAKAQDSKGNKALIVRGYVYDVDNNRQYLKTGAFNTVSPSAIVDLKPVVIDQESARTVNYVEKSNPLSLDFVRKFTEGLRGAAKLSSEGASMELSAELMKAVASMEIADLEKVNPKLANELRSQNTANKDVATAVSEMSTRFTNQVLETTKYMQGNAIAEEIAKRVGCEMSELPNHFKDFENLRQSQVALAIETALTGIKDDKLKKAIKDDLISRKISDPEQAKLQAESAISMLKIVAASRGEEFGSISDNTDDNGNPAGGGKPSGVVSSEFAKMRERQKAGGNQ